MQVSGEVCLGQGSRWYTVNSKRTLSKADTSLRRTANWSMPNCPCLSVTRTLSKADTSLSQTADTFFFQLFGSKTSRNGHRMFTKMHDRPENSAIRWCVSLVPKLNNKRKTTSFVWRLIHKHSKFAWAVLGSVRTTKRNATSPSCDHEQWRFGYQVTWTLSKADTSVKRTVALVPRVKTL